MSKVFSCESCGAEIPIPVNSSDPFVTCQFCGFPAEIPAERSRQSDASSNEPPPANVNAFSPTTQKPESADIWDPFEDDLPSPTANSPMAAPPSDALSAETSEATAASDDLLDVDGLAILPSIVDPISEVFTEPLTDFDPADLSIGQFDEVDTSDYTLAPPSVEVIDLSDRMPDLVVQLIPSNRVFVQQIGIPDRQLKAAIAAYAAAVKSIDVLALFDNTPQGNECEGFLLTKDSLFMSPPERIQLKSIVGAKVREDHCIELSLAPMGSATLETSRFLDRVPWIVELFNRIAQINELAKANAAGSHESHFGTLIRHLFPDDRAQLFHRSQEIPQSSLLGAISSFAPGIRADEVLAVFDSSFDGDGGSGLLLTETQVCFRNGAATRPQQVFLSDISGARAVSGGVAGDSLELTLTTRAKQVIKMDIGKKKLSAVAQLFNQIARSPKSSPW